MGGSGGGGSAGRTDFPVHVKAMHTIWGLGTTAYDGIATDLALVYSGAPSLFDVTRTAVGGSPFSGGVAYASATRIGNMETEVGAFATIVDALDDTTDWAALFAQAITTVEAGLNAPTLNAATDIASAWIDPSEVQLLILLLRG